MAKQKPEPKLKTKRELMMGVHTALLEIIQDNNCPLYQLGDELFLKGNTLSFPKDKAACLTLIGVLTEFLSVYEQLRPQQDGDFDRFEINCGGEISGCKGRVRLGYQQQEQDEASKITDPDEIDAIAYGLKNFSMFSELDELSIREIVRTLNVKRFSPGETIIWAGDPGTNLYIILTGEVEVVSENGLHIATLTEGDLFGEMSLISGEPIGAEVRAKKSVRVLYLSGNRFRKILSRFSTMKMYFARLLAQRISRLNQIRSEKLAPGMTGDMAEMPPSEIFQIMNMHHKNGALIFENLPGGSAIVRFRDGLLIDAEYNQQCGKEAFFKLLQEKGGRFYFSSGNPKEFQSAEPLGDFIWLLIEGMNLMDQQPGKTT